MPYLLKGLKSKCADLRRANYLILSQLSNVVTFQKNVQEEILTIISKVNRFEFERKERRRIVEFRDSRMTWSKKIC